MKNLKQLQNQSEKPNKIKLLIFTTDDANSLSGGYKQFLKGELLMSEQNPNPNPEPNPEPTPNPEPQPGNDGDVLDKFQKIKENYESKLNEKDERIKELEKELVEKDEQNKNALNDLNNEVDERLKQSEEYKEILKKVEVLEKERAEATVDAYIQKGIILPTQRDTAVKLCLSDNDTFLDLYRDAKPIVQTEQKRVSVPVGTAERIVNYFKK